MSIGPLSQKLTGNAATTGNVNVTIPSGIQSNDVLFIVACSQDNQTHSITGSGISGWTNLFQTSPGTQAQFSVWWKRTTGTESTPTVTRGTTTTAIAAEVITIRGCVTSGNPWEAISSSPTTATSTPLATTGLTSTSNNAFLLHLFARGGLTANGTFATPSAGCARRQLGASTCLVQNAGTSTNRAAVGAAFAIQAVPGASGNASQPFGGTAGAGAAAAGVLLVLTPAAGLLPSVVQPLQVSPSGKDFNEIDRVGGSVILQDINPAGSSDLFGLFRTASGTADVWYLLVSTDSGVSWSHISASSGTAGVTTATPWYQAICQDTVNYAVHAAFGEAGVGFIKYHRIALTYTSSHITGWTWTVSDVQGPSFDGSGDPGGENTCHVEMRQCADGAGTPILVLAGIDQPSSITGCVARLVVSRTTGLTPSASSDWKKLTAHSTTGFDVVAEKLSSAGADTGTLPKILNSRDATYESSHNSDLTFAQVGSNGDLHFLMGKMYYNDTAAAVASGCPIERYRFTIAGGSQDWALDTGTNPAVVDSQTTNAVPQMGNAIGTSSLVYFAWGNPSGLHISTVDASNTWTANAVTQPDTTAGINAGNIWWNIAINVLAGGNICAAWGRFDNQATQDTTLLEGTWTGSSWTTNDITVPLCVYRDSNNNFEPGNWTPILISTGVGVFFYPFIDFDGSLHRWASMVFTGFQAGTASQSESATATDAFAAGMALAVGLSESTSCSVSFACSMAMGASQKESTIAIDVDSANGTAGKHTPGKFWPWWYRLQPFSRRRIV